MYRAEGRPYVRLRYPNAMNVQLQIGDMMYPFLETEKMCGRLRSRWNPASIIYESVRG